MRRVLILAVASVVGLYAPAAAASDYERCDPTNEDLFDNMFCSEARAQRVADLQAKLEGILAQYDALVLENGALSRRVVLAQQARNTLREQLRNATASRNRLARAQLSQQAEFAAAEDLLRQITALEASITRQLETFGHCLSNADYQAAVRKQEEIRKSVAEWRDVIGLGSGSAGAGAWLAKGGLKSFLGVAGVILTAADVGLWVGEKTLNTLPKEDPTCRAAGW
jgi:hypothetical protein